MKNIIFIAPPAAGKGTQSKLISKEFKIPHISIGEIMREYRNPDTEIGRIIIKCQDERALVPNEITFKILQDRLSKSDCNNGYILDGFPRSMEQALEYDNILLNLNKEIGNVIYMDIDKEVALKRTLSRVVCSKCGETYNLENINLKPKKDGICDKCGCDLKVRTDDNESTFLKGFETYLNQTKPLIDYYNQRGILIQIKIEEQDSILDVFNKIKSIIG